MQKSSAIKQDGKEPCRLFPAYIKDDGPIGCHLLNEKP